MKRDLIELITQAQMDDAVRVVVFTGQGRAFWAGDDLGGYEAERPSSMPEIFGGHHNAAGTYNSLRTISQAVNTAVRRLDKLTVAAINGFAIQTGFSFALACDFRIAARSARMGSATLRFGLLPDEGGQWLLVQHLGVARATDFMMRKRIVDADTAHELGLVHEVVDDEELPAAAAELAAELADGPQVAHAHAQAVDPAGCGDDVGAVARRDRLQNGDHRSLARCCRGCVGLPVQAAA